MISSLGPLGTECPKQGQDGSVGLIRSSLQDESGLGYMGAISRDERKCMNLEALAIKS